MLYASGGGTGKQLAEQLAFAVKAAGFNHVTCADSASVIDPESLFLSDSAVGTVWLLVMATWQGGEPPSSARWFCR